MTAPFRKETGRHHQVPSSVAISGYGGGSGWRPGSRGKQDCRPV